MRGPLFEKTSFIKSVTTRVRKLGGGTFSRVLLVKYKDEDAVLKVGLYNDNFHQQMFNNEAHVLFNLDGAGGAPRLIMAAVNSPMILMTYVPHPTLRDVLLQRTLQSQSQALSMFRSMALAFAQVHELGYVHLDVKKDNILVDITSDFKVYLIDFGKSCSQGDRQGTSPKYNHHMLSIVSMAPQPRKDVSSMSVLMEETFNFLTTDSISDLDPNIFSLC
ncbi:hypothetical protein Pmani_021680 [Petrolisthes manimaculis]|uniref:Protein kinase domain-containing protein n=1 Tax=Petrolisthes manimaculis TaxID=1843537 RepID=A0AAE1PDB8_9EUCA|nr:hypothetical protein Pmani_021680 [Petrolisthes manimaculis]